MWVADGVVDVDVAVDVAEDVADGVAMVSVTPTERQRDCANCSACCRSLPVQADSMQEVAELTKVWLLHKQVSSVAEQPSKFALVMHGSAQEGRLWREMRPAPIEERAADKATRATAKRIVIECGITTMSTKMRTLVNRLDFIQLWVLVSHMP